MSRRLIALVIGNAEYVNAPRKRRHSHLSETRRMRFHCHRPYPDSIFQPIQMNPFTSFELAESIVDRFRELLHKNNINPPVRSGIEDELLAPYEVLQRSKNLSCIAARPDLLAEAAGMFDLAAKVLAIETQPEFSSFVPHLALFASVHPLASSVQTTPGERTDDVHRKLVELYLGSLAVHVGHRVELDHPTASRGDNPDVLFDFCPVEGNTKRWALAIKTISTKAGQTIFDRINEAAKQINAKACPAERGIVVINMQGSLDHSALRERFFVSAEEAMNELSRQMQSLADSANTNRIYSDWDEVLNEKVSPIILLMGHAYVHVKTVFSPETPTVIKRLIAWNPTQREDQEATCICFGLNEFMQRIQRGVPGTDHTLPE